VAGHPAPFSYLDLRLDSSGLRGSLVIHDFDAAHELGLEPPTVLLDPQVAADHRAKLLEILASRLRITADGRTLTPTWGALDVLPERQSLRLAVQFDRTPPGMIQIDTTLFPYDQNHQTFINIYEGGRLRHQAILDLRHTSLDYYAGSAQGTLAVLRTFVPAGVHHILIGPDHILFLIGLLLLGGSFLRLAGIVTAFTIGHSITLTLAALDVVSPPASIVEPAIALSIVVVGADNLLLRPGGRESLSPGRSRGGHSLSPGTGERGRLAEAFGAGGRDRAEARPATMGERRLVRVGEKDDPEAFRDLRPWVAGAFGLVHGFGFASVLKEFGLPPVALGWSLFSFNAGVEIGQMAIVAVVALLLSSIRRQSVTLGNRLAVAGSIGIVAAGSYWFVERVFLTGGAS
jgi:hydrogenase/urease accessory protein HupE